MEDNKKTAREMLTEGYSINDGKKNKDVKVPLEQDLPDVTPAIPWVLLKKGYEQGQGK